MSRRKHHAEAQRQFDKALSARNVGAVRAALASGEIVPTAELLAEVFDSAPVAIVEALIDAGAPCDKILSAHFNDLRAACHKGSIEGKMKVLLARADLTKVKPPPVWQCIGDLATMEVVLAHGADPNAPPASSADVGYTPLLRTLSLSGERNELIAQMLIAAGSDVSAELSKDGRFGRDDLCGANALHLACHFRRPPALVRRILDTGCVNLNASALGGTALSMAVEHCHKEDCRATLSLLLEAGADPDLGKPTPLEKAFTHCNFDVVLLLLQHGATPKKLNVAQVLRGIRFAHQASRFPLLCLLRAFGGDVSLAQLGAVYDPQRHGGGLAWSEGQAERIWRLSLPRLLVKIP